MKKYTVISNMNIIIKVQAAPGQFLWIFKGMHYVLGLHECKISVSLISAMGQNGYIIQLGRLSYVY